MTKRFYVQLGRAGDILNVIPLLRREHEETGRKPRILVQQSFLPLFEGVSYARPLPWIDDFREIVRAMSYAEKMAEPGEEIVCTQIHGYGLQSTDKCWSFMRESWDRLPGCPAWGSLPLVFDRRDAGVERMVVANLMRRFEYPDRPYIVVALDGTSSPFPYGPEVRRALTEEARGQVNVVDVSGFIAPRFFDLLGLLENAACLLTVDSGLLHLAHAVPSLPVVALVTREPDAWHGSP